MTDTQALIERLRHCSQNTKDEYLHELTGRAATALTEANTKLVKAGEDAARYHWLRDHSCPPHNFYISVPDEFYGVRYSSADVDIYIDEARACLAELGEG